MISEMYIQQLSYISNSLYYGPLFCTFSETLSRLAKVADTKGLLSKKHLHKRRRSEYHP